MASKPALLCALLPTSALLCGCAPAGGTARNANAGGSTAFAGSLDINLGADSRFDLVGGIAVDRQIAVDLTAELGVNALTGLGVGVDESDVSLQSTGQDNATTTGLTTLEVFVSAPGAPDACSSGVSLGQFAVGGTGDSAPTIAPAQLDGSAEALATVSGGAFEMCLRAASAGDATLIVNRMQVRFNSALPTRSCDEILELAQVRAALEVLTDNGFSFALQSGSEPRNLEAIYQVRESIEFDPDGTDTGSTRDRVDALTAQTADHIHRAVGSAGLDQSISGGADGVNLCVLARSNHPPCDQTIARLESYAVVNNGAQLDGTFLAVVVERHAATSSTCGGTGDFVYGSIDLTRQSATLQVSRRGKVALPEGFRPDLIVVPDDGGPGTVTDRGSSAVVQFEVSGAFATSTLPIPAGLDAAGYNGIALSRDNRLLALVSDAPDEVLVFDNARGILNVEATADGAALGGDVFDFSPAGQFVYVVNPATAGATHLFAFRTATGFIEPVGQFAIPGAETPTVSRLNGAGDQLAVLLRGAGGADKAQFVIFHDVATGMFGAAIDLRAATDGLVSDRHLIYSGDGEHAFMAGEHGVVAVETTAPFTVTAIDVSGLEGDPDSRGDEVAAIDVSDDGRVVVAAVDRVNGDANFAVVDADSLAVLNRQTLERISARGAIDVAHFDSGRACIVVNERGRAVGVQTVEPFAVSEELSAADDEFNTILGRAAAGGNIVAVINTSEQAVYLYELAP